MSNKEKRGDLKIPKYLCYKILVLSWNPIQFITELVNTKNNKGKTVLDLVRENGHAEIITLLEPYEKIVEVIEPYKKQEVNQSTSWCILN
jgi:hypothetical protein